MESNSESPPPQRPLWCNFSWKPGPRINNLFIWNNELKELECSHLPAELAIAKNNIETCGPQYLWNFAKKIINPYELIYTYKKDIFLKVLVCIYH